MEAEPKRGGSGRIFPGERRRSPLSDPLTASCPRFAAHSPLWLVLGAVLAGCFDPPPPRGTPTDAFAFGVYGDGPYYPWEEPRARRLLADAEASAVDFLIHIGDILGTPCSDEMMRERRSRLEGVKVPVVYTPGDNEWADCHADEAGGYDPLERLATLREIFFDDPATSLGACPMAVTSQAKDAGFAEFPENTRWDRGGFIFATLHIVGSFNATALFPGRDHRHDAEVRRRSGAALAWMDGVFREASSTGASGVVLAVHANVRLERGGGGAYEPFVSALRNHVAAFPGEVLLIHGDTHDYRLDQPLTDDGGAVLENFTRLETFGSPDIGWVRVVVDTLRGQVIDVEPRLMRRWF